MVIANDTRSKHHLIATSLSIALFLSVLPLSTYFFLLPICKLSLISIPFSLAVFSLLIFSIFLFILNNFLYSEVKVHKMFNQFIPSTSTAAGRVADPDAEINLIRIRPYRKHWIRTQPYRITSFFSFSLFIYP